MITTSFKKVVVIALAAALAACSAPPPPASPAPKKSDQPAKTTPPQAAAIDYKTVDQAWVDLTTKHGKDVWTPDHANPGQKKTPTNTLAALDREVVLYGPTPGLSWIFVANTSPAFPSVIRREFGAPGDPIALRMLCQAPKKACDALEARVRSAANTPPPRKSVEAKPK